MIKIALIADIHANYPVFNSILDEIDKMNINKYIFLGDYILDGFDNNKVLDLIKQLDAYVIRGNKEDAFMKEPNPNWYNHYQFINFAYTYDHLSKDNLNYIRQLPIYLIIEVEGIKILISHGSPYSSNELCKEDDYDIFDKLIDDFNCDVYIFGHTHISFCTKYKNRYFINPGSIGMPLDGPESKYGILTINNGIVEYEKHIFKYDYNSLEKYYKESEYYKVVDTWAKLSLMNIKFGYNCTFEFLSRTYEIANKLNIDTKDGIPNDLWIKEYNNYIKGNNWEKYV